MKTTAFRSTEIFIECPHCKSDIVHIPDKEISEINAKNTENLKCPNCKKNISIFRVNY